MNSFTAILDEMGRELVRITGLLMAWKVRYIERLYLVFVTLVEGVTGVTIDNFGNEIAQGVIVIENSTHIIHSDHIGIEQMDIALNELSLWNDGFELIIQWAI